VICKSPSVRYFQGMKISAVFKAALFLACPLTALAGPPFVTDDPEPVDYQHWEFYIASQHTETSDGWSGTAPHIEINYGVITNVQLHLIAPLAYDAPKDGSTLMVMATLNLA